jgi:hypothetical protein
LKYRTSLECVFVIAVTVSKYQFQQAITITLISLLTRSISKSEREDFETMINCLIESAPAIKNMYDEHGLADALAQYLVGKLARELKGAAAEFALESAMGFFLG